MPKIKKLNLDEIGPWSEVKLEIIQKYAQAYSTILSKQSSLHHIYIDAFAGAGVHISKLTKEFISGSPLNALNVIPPFKELHLIDLDELKVESLKKLTSSFKNVFIYNEDCNKILHERILPKITYKSFKRALCILDPYGLTLDWKVVELAGTLGTIDIFINFPIADINRNVLRHDRSKVAKADIERMNIFWGDSSWESSAYSSDESLFEELEEKQDNQAVVDAYIDRLKKVAKFENIPVPLAMKNSKGATVYYLIFASQKPVANHIINDIFRKHG